MKTIGTLRVTSSKGPTTEPPGPNVVRGTVRLTEYLGREHGVEVALEGGPTLTVSLAHPVAVGSALALRLPPERVVILPAEGDAR